jgi:predicted GNAT family N-acyltransferase
LISTRWVNGTGEGFEFVCALRRAVYVDEIGLSDAFVQDEWDALSAHLLVRDEDGVLAATGRLYPCADGWRIGRIAVLRERRGRRLGDLTIRLLCARALDTVPDADITVYALPDVAPLYEKFGFVREGDPTLESGASVIPMRVHAANFDWHRPCEKATQ